MPDKKRPVPLPPDMELPVWEENPVQAESYTVHGPNGLTTQESMRRPVPGSLVDQLYPKSEGWNPGVAPAPAQSAPPPPSLVSLLWERYKSLQAKRKA